MNSTVEKIKILLVDDHQLMLDGLKTMLTEQDNLLIVGAVANAERALTELTYKNIDVILADINLPGMDGIEFTRQVTTRYPKVRLVALTMHNESSVINQMIAAGASGFVIKSNSIDELIEAIRQVANGKKFLSPEVQAIVMDNIFRYDDAITKLQPGIVQLTQRETEVLNLIAYENSNKEIAEKLFISERTVETHRKNIFAKTKTKSMAGLIRYALEHKLISK
ncbi:MAG: response regulator transcription factor [Bacteroidales bacterium]|jgi:DNA-binding NarL/FixJ family response regulator|nr:response regulator transcription factor [Bacteroidales bacterium]NCU34882.1 response regulator transcription factor [Candidatus Falkowbacteria bacterium]MDD2631892.1 response regulator transcription factor [Bacteroidales bacterium]MDD3130984.1 response regulator transcription factor [Bacteroidales bacterium]MDD3525924.1 response regulator transcription factor [Bacteroidales bacterium]